MAYQPAVSESIELIKNHVIIVEHDAKIILFFMAEVRQSSDAHFSGYSSFQDEGIAVDQENCLFYAQSCRKSVMQATQKLI